MLSIRQDNTYTSDSQIDDIIKEGCSTIIAQNYCRNDLITHDSRLNRANYIGGYGGTIPSITEIK